MKNNNKGFTLLEVIIAVTIIAALVAGFTQTTSLIFSSAVDDATNDLSALMTHCKIATLSGEQDPRLEITKEGDDYFATLYAENVIINRENFADGRFTITYTDLSDGIVTVNESTSLTLSFERSTGAFSSPVFKAINLKAGASDSSIVITASTGYFEID